MKVSVAINNYNYGKYIIECVESVLSQTYKNIEIIIVDDGSTDNSLELLYSYYANHQNIKIVAKQNGGQLSAFNEVLQHITGEIVFFLDADDLYKEDYIETILKIYDTNEEIDFIFCALEKFFPDGTTELLQRYKKTKKFGFSVITTFIHKEWIGSETSAISMRLQLLKKVLPIPLEQDWITRADDCLVWGTSIVGAQKYYLAIPLVKYRVHGNNHYFGNKNIDTYSYQYNRILVQEKLFNYFKTKNSIPDYLTDIIKLNSTAANILVREYLSQEFQDYKLLKKYIKMILKSNLNVKNKYKNVKKLILKKC